MLGESANPRCNVFFSRLNLLRYDLLLNLVLDEAVESERVGFLFFLMIDSFYS